MPTGSIGLGEAAPLSLRGGHALAQIAQDLDRRCRPLLEGAESTPEPVAARDQAASGPRSRAQALAAVELALLDLAGKLLGRAGLARCSAPTRRARCACNATLVAGEPAGGGGQRARVGRRGASSTFKLKVGMDGDVEQVRGGARGGRAGARGSAWTPTAPGRVEEAIATPAASWSRSARAGRAAGRRPSRRWPRCAAHVDVPLAADESVVTVEDARGGRRRCCDAATVKLAKVGGVSRAADRDASCPSTCRARSTGRSASRRRRTSLRRSRGRASPTAWPHRCCSPTRSPRGSAPSGTGTSLTGAPGLGVEIDELALAEAGI